MDRSLHISAARLARLLVGRAEDGGPLHRQLSDGLAELIRLGELPPGARLPSERSLAPAVVVSRTTVTAAYTTLREQGLVSGRRGSGTYVGVRDAAGTGDGRHLAGDDRLGAFTNPTARSTIDFSSAAMPGLELVADVVEADDGRSLRPLLAHHGYHPAGLPELRDAIAQHLSERGLPSSADEVMVTGGAQQALQVISAAFLAPGDRVVVEDPTYRGAITTLVAAGARIRTVPSGSQGVDLHALEKVIARDAPRLVYLLPVVHNPTGAVLPEAAGRQLARLAARTGTMIVDDAAASETVYATTQPPTLASFDADAQVLMLGSFSKLFWGGLRVGWIRASRQTITRLTRAKGLVDLGTSVPTQLIARRLLPLMDTARNERRDLLLGSYAQLASSLTRLLPTWRWDEPAGGGSLWVRLPTGNAAGFAQVALRFGVELSPGSVFSAHDHFDDHVRLPFVANPSTIHIGARRLAEAWEVFTTARTEHEPASPALVI